MLITCDISGKTSKDRYLVFGTSWIPKEQLPQYEKAVSFFRIKNRFWGELKWSKISPQKIKEFKNFLTLSLKEFPFKIRVLVRDRKIPYPPGRFENEADLESTFYHILMKNHIKRVLRRDPTIKSFHILLDRGELDDKKKEVRIREKCLILKNFLESSLHKQKLSQSIDHLQSCDSKICSAIQLCDLVLGATSAKLNQSAENISKDKKEIIKHIEEIFNHPLDKPTSPLTTKYNLWIWRPPAE